ncbi:hypothetical protein BC628DRAFT_987840 [Trametes gibbosa]|nr:hypothetical protein BC628DRAFT_987840 [Trametes gibbosa]
MKPGRLSRPGTARIIGECNCRRSARTCRMRDMRALRSCIVHRTGRLSQRLQRNGAPNRRNGVPSRRRDRCRVSQRGPHQSMQTGSASKLRTHRTDLFVFHFDLSVIYDRLSRMTVLTLHARRQDERETSPNRVPVYVEGYHAGTCALLR